MKRDARGFAVFEIFVVVLIAVAIGVVGFMVFNKKDTDTNTPVTQSASTTVPAAPEVSDTRDLDAASKALDETDLDAAASDTTQLDSQLSGL